MIFKKNKLQIYYFIIDFKVKHLILKAPDTMLIIEPTVFNNWNSKNVCFTLSLVKKNLTFQDFCML